MSRFTVVPDLDASSYRRHSLHREDRVWVEKNCYIDLWIEALHSLRLEPVAMLPFVVSVDFEGDQWTFFKPSHDELRELYGVDVQELTVWRPLLDHAIEHLGSGRWISTEADAWWLPDTAGTDYRHKHTKTTIVLNDLDVDRQQLGYFHNAGYFRLEGEDFVKTFRLDSEPDPAYMPLFAEFVRLDRLLNRPQPELAQLSLELWRRHLQRLPRQNPVRRFGDRMANDLSQLQQRGLAYYHAWAFAGTRQLGSAFELAALNLRWLQDCGVSDLSPAIDAFERISNASKALILKGARLVNTKRPFDGSATFADMSQAWETGLNHLLTRWGV